ncbi:MAG: 3-dehydroquinate synthase family protein [bacterium]
MYKVEMELQSKYNIYIDRNLDIKKYISEVFENKNIFIITDTNVKGLHIDNLLNQLKEYNVKVITIKPGEENKSIATYTYITTLLTSYNVSRDSLIIGFGGGVVGDIAAFAASTILRGVQYVSIPTTLLSQVDSSIGGKTGLNLSNVKNVIGTFFQPSLVLIDTLYLDTLNVDEFNSGLGEVIKCGMIKNKGILSLLKDNFDVKEIIYKCLLVKKHYVELDPYDRNERMLLNFGHTFGHVIELEYGLKHGLAVIDGMILALKYGIDNECTNPICLSELTELLNKLDIKYHDFDYKLFINQISTDKKNTENNFTFVLLTELGIPVIKKVQRNT